MIRRIVAAAAAAPMMSACFRQSVCPVRGRFRIDQVSDNIIITTMKKTVNVNIASCPFTLDEDAYEVLKSYLDDIASRLPATDCASMDNIEMRIARLLSSLSDSEPAIVSLPMISRIEDEIGRPESFGRRADETLQRCAVERSLTAAEEETDAETVVAEQVTLQTSSAHPFESPMREQPYEYPSHLYRSRDERIIAGDRKSVV